MIEIELWRDGPGFYWRLGVNEMGDDLEHTSEIQFQIYAQICGWA